MKAKIVYGTNPFKRYFADEREVSEEEFHRLFPTRIEDLLQSRETLPSHGTKTWPMVSEALGVHESQVAEANARAKRHGIAVEYRPDGRAVISSREARKRLLRLEGMHDNHAGYGD